MKPMLATLALVLIATFAIPAPAEAMVYQKIEGFFAGISFPIDGISRSRSGAPGDGCSRQLTFEMTDENAAYELKNVIVSSYNTVSFRFELPNGRMGTLRLLGVTVLNFGPAAVDGRKGWSGTLCYERQELELGGQELE